MRGGLLEKKKIEGDQQYKQYGCSRCDISNHGVDRSNRGSILLVIIRSCLVIDLCGLPYVVDHLIRLLQLLAKLVLIQGIHCQKKNTAFFHFLAQWRIIGHLVFKTGLFSRIHLPLEVPVDLLKTIVGLIICVTHDQSAYVAEDGSCSILSLSAWRHKNIFFLQYW